MALTKQIIKQTETLTVIKVFGTTDTATIDLSTDLLSSTMALSGTLDVSITHVMWYVSPGVADQITVVRNSIPVMNLFQNGFLDFAGEGAFADDTQSASNLVVTIVGTGGIYITLRKTGGYKSKIEPWAYSVYDNETVVGS